PGCRSCRLLPPRAHTRDSSRTGCLPESSALLLRSFVERCRDDARPSLFASDQDVEFRAGRRFVERKIREPDRFFQCRRVRAAGDDADFFAALDDRISVPGDSAIDHLEPDKLAPRPLRSLALA